MALRRIAYSDLGLLQRDEVVHYDKVTNNWILNKSYLETLYLAMRDAGADLQRILPYGVYEPHPYKMRSQFAPYTLVPSSSSPYGEAFQLLTFNTYYFPIPFAYRAGTYRIIEAEKMLRWFNELNAVQFESD